MIPKSGNRFRKRWCSNKKIERDDDSKKSHPSLASGSTIGSATRLEPSNNAQGSRSVPSCAPSPVEFRAATGIRTGTAYQQNRQAARTFPGDAPASDDPKPAGKRPQPALAIGTTL